MNNKFLIESEFSNLKRDIEKHYNTYQDKCKIAINNQLIKDSSNLDSLNRQLDKYSDDLFKSVDRSLTNSLSSIYDKGYYSTNLEIQNIKQNIKKELMNSKWSGLNYKERIDNHNRVLKFNVNQNINRCIIDGNDFAKVYDTFYNELNKEINALDRLCKTELQAYSNMGLMENLKDNKIEYVSIVNDTACTHTCAPYMVNKVKVEDGNIGFDLPPFHPNCQCQIQWEEENN